MGVVFCFFGPFSVDDGVVAWSSVMFNIVVSLDAARGGGFVKGESPKHPGELF